MVHCHLPHIVGQHAPLLGICVNLKLCAYTEIAFKSIHWSKSAKTSPGLTVNILKISSVRVSMYSEKN